MLRLLFIALLASLLPSLRGAVPVLLEQALGKVIADYDRWAYTQTKIEKNEKGKVLNRAVVRFDPSKPYPEQYTPLSIDGQTPSPGEQRKYRRQGERRGDRIAKAEDQGKAPPQQTLGELMDLERASLVEETAETATFEVPLKKEGNRRLPPEKFQVLARVNKATAAFEAITAQLRSPMRADVVVKVKSGSGRLEFAAVEPDFAPTVTAISGSGAASIVFVPIGRSYSIVRSDFQRVKPFSDRFKVKLGPLKSIDF